LKGRSHSTTTAPRVEEFHYNEFNYLTGWDLSTGGPKTTTTYTYDTIGNMLSEHSNAPTKPAHQDRLYGTANTNASTRHIGPHALGHIDATHSGGVENYSYDAKGRLTKNEQDDGTRDISDYTAFDLPKTVKDPTGKTTTFAYDAFGQRFKKTGPDGTTIYIAGLFEQRTDKNNKTSYIYHLPGIGQAVDNGTTISTEYTLTDAQGSTGLALDKQGNTTAAFHYDPYGAPINPDGTPDTTRAGTPNGTPPGNHTRGFQGNEHDDALRLINNNGRLYDPEAKILTTPDPILTNHAYAYTNNNPTNFTDPSGYNPTCTYCLDPGTSSNGLGNDITAGLMGAGTLGTTGYGGYNAYNGLTTGGAQTASFGQINDAITNPYASLGASDNAAFTPIITNAQNIIDTINAGIQDVKETWNSLRNEGIWYEEYGGDATLSGGRACTGNYCTKLTVGHVIDTIDITTTAYGINSAANTIERTLLWEERALAELAAARTSAMRPLRYTGPIENMADGAARGAVIPDGTIHCTHCAIATDATASGRPASALGDDHFVTLEEIATKGYPTEVEAAQQYARSLGQPGGLLKFENVGDVFATMQYYGNESRGIVFGDWDALKQGHAWNVMNHAGDVRFWDEQAMKVFGGMHPLSYFGADRYHLLITHRGPRK
ncbi:RHS repeat-associated core domain-containing protein, partial [Streptomyces sp. NPDC052013]|uniref:RHS repeat-associated core domain-containing protein n=1 Tax=Streptomyces sp. NPDC052013 TaxID=3365679 RepID=UPI0037D36CF6